MNTKERFIEICESYGLVRTGVGDGYFTSIKYGRKNEFTNHVMIHRGHIVHGYIDIDEDDSRKNQIVTAATDPVAIYNEAKLKYYIEQYLKNEKQYMKACRLKDLEEL